MEARRIEISHKTILFTLGWLAFIWIIYQVRDVIIIFFMAIILMSALSPIVEKLQKLYVPKPLAIGLVYIVIIGIIAGLFSIGVTPLVEQTNNLVQNLPKTFENVIPANFINPGLIERELTSFTGNALTATLTILGQIVALISVGVLTFYLLLQHDRLDHMVTLFSFGKEKQFLRVVHRSEEKLGAWFRGQVILSLIIGVASFFALTILGVPYALPLAILAGLLEVVPMIGPIISAIPAVLVAYLTSPVLALFTVAAFFIIQQLENHIIVPQVMKRAVGLNPLIVLLAVAMGGKLIGILGALLAVPIAVILQIILEEIIEHQKKTEE